jgi:methionyl-tRNA formyltransferase
MKELAARIAYITINPYGPFLQSLQAGFAEVGISPAYLISVSPARRLFAEWRKHRFSVISRVLLPKLRAIWKTSRSNSKIASDSLPSPKVLKVKKLNSDETVQLLKRLQILYLINAGAGIFSSKILAIPDLIVVNAHAGILPKYRNMNVAEWAIFNGDPIVGTVHRIDRGLDTGPILMQKPLCLTAARSVAEARESAFDQVARMVAPTILAHASGAIQEIPQEREDGMTWYTMHSYFLAKVEAKLGSATE